jgi:signal transduction histidine kinase
VRGLFISKNIIEAHGGKIWAQNNHNLGKGDGGSKSQPLAHHVLDLMKARVSLQGIAGLIMCSELQLPFCISGSVRIEFLTSCSKEML